MTIEITKKLKIYAVIVVISVILYFVGQSAYYKYQWFKEKINRVESIEVRLDTLENRKNKEIKSISNNVTKSRNTKTNITNKLKKDEETIDNSDVTDADVDRLLTRFKD